MDNSGKIILDLCGGTGSWSRPYKEAGYDVRLITLPDYDVRTYEPPEGVYGILAAPPCTDFASSGARWFAEKDRDGRTLESMGVLVAVLEIIARCQPTFWALENPVGRIRRWMHTPTFIFDPWEFGDPYTKKTLLWGKFNIPEKAPCEPIQVPSIKRSNNPKIGFPSKMHLLPPSVDRATLRSITPPGFAQAFFRANQ